MEQVAVLRGHADEVLTLTGHATAPLLVSGSEDSTARIWDLRTGRAVLGIHAAAPVTAAAVEATDTLAGGLQDVWLGVGRSVALYDLRKASLVVRDASVVSKPGRDDVAVLTRQPDQAVVVAGDDAGDLRVFKAAAPRRATKQLRVGRSDELVLSMAWHPRTPHHVCVGTTGSRVLVWDVARGRCLREITSVDATACTTGASSVQLINPPHVHALAAMPAHVDAGTSVLTAALGSGSIVQWRLAEEEDAGAADQPLDQRIRAWRAHASIAAAVVPVAPGILASAGADCALRCWVTATIDANEASEQVPPAAQCALPLKPNALARVGASDNASLAVATTGRDIRVFRVSS